MILVTLAAVAIFLIVQSIPALFADSEDASILARQLLGVRRPARLRHGLGRLPRAAHGPAALDRHRPLHLALRAAPPAHGASATSSTCSPRCPRSSSASGASACSPRPSSRSTPGSSRTSAGSRCSPAPSRAPAAPSSPPAIVLAVMVLPDHHRHLPRGVPADARAPRGGRARARRDPLGDDPDRGAPLRPPGHHLGVHARPRPRARRDDGRRDGALRLGRRSRSAAHLGRTRRRSPRTSRSASPRRYGIERQRAHRDRPHPVRRHLRGQRDRPLRSSTAARNSRERTDDHDDDTRSRRPRPDRNSLTAGRLPTLRALDASSARALVVGLAVFGVLAAADGGELQLGRRARRRRHALHRRRSGCLSLLVEGRRKAMDRLVTALVTGAFVLALIPLVSLTITVVTYGLAALRRRVLHLLDAQRRRRGRRRAARDRRHAAHHRHGGAHLGPDRPAHRRSTSSSTAAAGSPAASPSSSTS